MDDENRNIKRVLDAVKAAYKITPAKEKRLDFDPFIITNKGKHFRHLYSWRVDEFQNEAYLCSLRNSIEIEGMNNYYFFQKHDVSGRYLALLINSSTELPDLIIRPDSITSKISNLFLDFDIKLEGRTKFNSNYILESSYTAKECEKILTPNLTTHIAEEKDLYLEINNSHIFLKFEQEMSEKNALMLLRIGSLLDEAIRNAA